MGDNNQLSIPEDDEDLEALRLAALQSLKKKAISETPSGLSFTNNKDRLNHFNGSPRGKQKRGKFTRTSQGRTPRNGQFNGWSRNSNLIAVPMVTEDSDSCNKKKTEEDIPKLILPQDRYHKKEKTPERNDATSKFDRYEKSDESDSESDDDQDKSDEEKPELKRSNSLEALMAELENEIQGVSSKEEKPKPKPKKKRKISVTTPESETKPETKPINILKENLKPESEPVKKFQNFKQRKWQQKPRRHNATNYIPPNIVHQVVPPPEIIQPIIAFAPPPIQTFSSYNPLGFDNGVFAPPPVVFEAPPPQLPPLHVAPPLYDRPLSPLAINTDAFSTPTLAPLSPRSAAFVMENRAIIEKRKRRSFSRSPSPRFRRSKTPKRSVSPKRASKSPKKRSLSPSPIRKVIPPRVSSPKKPPIHDRLGLKSKTDSDDEKNKKKEESLDPILEARRKKFERNEITMKEGVIRLKKPEDLEEKKDEQDEIDEDILLEGDVEDTILLDHKVDALFSDEESDSDNEGRFKTKQETNQKISVLPFTKLINGVKSDIKTDLKLEEAKNKERINRKRYSSRSPKNPPKKLVKTPKKNEKPKQAIGIGNDRKIEIKIRNPAKYEKIETKIDEEKKIETEKESSESEDVATNITEGDLRAQLSRKRAERQKHPLPDVVPSRLLQNALQGVGFRKGKKTKNDDDNLVEGKLPIHLRLGAANSSDFGKKSRKHKKGSQEQVLCFVASLIIIFSLLKLSIVNFESNLCYSVIIDLSRCTLTNFALL